MTRIGFIVVYSSGHRADATNIGASELRHSHRAKGWRDIGFHYVIKRDGSVEKGRPDVQPGAHEPRINSHSLAICLVGGASGDTYAPAQLAALAALAARLHAEHPNAIVLGHRDVPGVRSDVPGFDVPAWWADQKETP